jgi:hypothetical protein
LDFWFENKHLATLERAAYSKSVVEKAKVINHSLCLSAIFENPIL